jgi:hypothetical protein
MLLIVVPKHDEYGNDTQMHCSHNFFYIAGRSIWSLREDDLTKQNPETIGFLFNLLQPEGETNKNVA